MAIAFHTSMPYMIGEPRPKRSKSDLKYVVKVYRADDRVCILVGDDMYVDVKDRKYVSLRQRWWQTKSPRQKIIEATERAQRIADELNHAELYMAHEFDISQRPGEV